MSRAEQLLNVFLDDWQNRGQRVSDDIRERFRKLAALGEDLILSNGDPLAAKAYLALVDQEKAIGVLAAEREMREAWQASAIQTLRVIGVVIDKVLL